MIDSLSRKKNADKVNFKGFEFETVKPIFHCDAKPFALGTFALPNAKDKVSFALGKANFSPHPMQNPNTSQWNIGCVGYQTQNFCVGHVHFMFFCVNFICVW